MITILDTAKMGEGLLSHLDSLGRHNEGHVKAIPQSDMSHWFAVQAKCLVNGSLNDLYGKIADHYGFSVKTAICEFNKAKVGRDGQQSLL